MVLVLVLITMEQIQELFNILKSTPEMAIWGLLIWCLYILAKLASIVYALKVVAQLAINKWHDFKIKGIDLQKNETELNKSKMDLLNQNRSSDLDKRELLFEKEQKDILKLSKLFKNSKISDIEMDDLRRLLNAMKSTTYIHQSDIDKAIEKISQN